MIFMKQEKRGVIIEKPSIRYSWYCPKCDAELSHKEVKVLKYNCQTHLMQKHGVKKK